MADTDGNDLGIEGVANGREKFVFGQAEGERVLEKVKGLGALASRWGPDANVVAEVCEPVSGREGGILLSSRGTEREVDESVEAVLGASREKGPHSSREQLIRDVPPVTRAEE